MIFGAVDRMLRGYSYFDISFFIYINFRLDERRKRIKRKRRCLTKNNSVWEKWTAMITIIIVNINFKWSSGSDKNKYKQQLIQNINIIYIQC